MKFWEEKRGKNIYTLPSNVIWNVCEILRRKERKKYTYIAFECYLKRLWNFEKKREEKNRITRCPFNDEIIENIWENKLQLWREINVLIDDSTDRETLIDGAESNFRGDKFSGTDPGFLRGLKRERDRRWRRDTDRDSYLLIITTHLHFSFRPDTWREKHRVTGGGGRGI